MDWVSCITHLSEEGIVPIRPFGMDEGHEKRCNCADGRGDEYRPHNWHTVHKDAGRYVSQRSGNERRENLQRSAQRRMTLHLLEAREQAQR